MEFFPQDLEAVLFDFEGTLVDFQWKIPEAVAEVLEMLLSMGFARAQLRSRKYSTLVQEAMEAAPRLGLRPEAVREAIGAIYDRYDEDALTRWKMRPGALDFLFALRSRGVRTALVSNVGAGGLAKALARLGLRPLLDIFLSRNDVPNLKPSPDGINLALEKLGARRQASLFIGDSLDDIHAARGAGLRALIITNGENPREEILQAQPHATFERYAELLAAIKSIRFPYEVHKSY
ncbi:MAG: HAD family hydrolase [Syntrophobacteraceae bacterium]